MNILDNQEENKDKKKLNIDINKYLKTNDIPEDLDDDLAEKIRTLKDLFGDSIKIKSIRVPDYDKDLFNSDFEDINISGEFDSDSEDEIDNPEEYCSVYSSIVGLSKPFGFNWTEEEMIDILEQAGYIICDVFDIEGSIIGKHAGRIEDEELPDHPNIEEQFEKLAKKSITNFILGNLN